MGLVLFVLFLVLTFAASPWWLLPLGALLFASSESKGVAVVLCIIIALAITVSPWWLFGLLVFLL